MITIPFLFFTSLAVIFIEKSVTKKKKKLTYNIVIRNKVATNSAYIYKRYKYQQLEIHLSYNVTTYIDYRVY